MRFSSPLKWAVDGIWTKEPPHPCRKGQPWYASVLMSTRKFAAREQKYLEATGGSIGNLIVAGLGRERRNQGHAWSMLCLGESLLVNLQHESGNKSGHLGRCVWK